MALDATPSGANSNSYVMVDEADAFFSTRLRSEAWTGEGDSTKKEAALIMATYRLEQEEFDFWRTDLNQALKWPRTGVITPDCKLIPSNAVPSTVKYATFELALVMLTTDLLSDTGLELFRQLSISGTISMTPRFNAAGELPPSVSRWLTASGAWLGRTGTVVLVRS